MNKRKLVERMSNDWKMRRGKFNLIKLTSDHAYIIQISNKVENSKFKTQRNET